MMKERTKEEKIERGKEGKEGREKEIEKERGKE